jgi:hypothetical protein
MLIKDTSPQAFAKVVELLYLHRHSTGTMGPLLARYGATRTRLSDRNQMYDYRFPNA